MADTTGPFVNQSGTTFATADLTSPLENVAIISSSLTGTLSVDLITSSIFYYTTAASGNPVFNFRGNANTTVNSLLAIGQSVSAVVLLTNGATPYFPTSIAIDGVTVTPLWLNGLAPTYGNASSVDVYNFTIVKTAASTYSVLATGPSRFA
jgi:hypothetical protein